jgi:serine protein kinase
LTLPTASVFAVLSRLEPPRKQGVTLVEKLRAYDGEMVYHFTREDVAQEKRHYPNEGMNGVSPRYVMNRLSGVASDPNVTCISPLNAMDSIWRGLSENLSLDQSNFDRYLGYIKDTVNEYNQRAIQTVQRAFEERFEQTASELLQDYIEDAAKLFTVNADQLTPQHDRNMREMERHAAIPERDRMRFRQEIHRLFTDLQRRGVSYDYTTEHRLKAAIEKRLFPDYKTLRSELSEPNASNKMADWRRKRGSVHNRLIQSYGYCDQCAADTVNYVIHLLRGRGDWREVFRTVRGEDIEWMWDLNPSHLANLADAVGTAEDDQSA